MSNNYKQNWKTKHSFVSAHACWAPPTWQEFTAVTEETCRMARALPSSARHWGCGAGDRVQRARGDEGPAAERRRRRARGSEASACYLVAQWLCKVSPEGEIEGKPGRTEGSSCSDPRGRVFPAQGLAERGGDRVSAFGGRRAGSSVPGLRAEGEPCWSQWRWDSLRPWKRSAGLCNSHSGSRRKAVRVETRNPEIRRSPRALKQRGCRQLPASHARRAGGLPAPPSPAVTHRKRQAASAL